MAVYEYLALKKNGDEVKGVLDEDTQRQARDKLRAQSLMPVSLKKVGDKTQSSSREQVDGWVKNRIKIKNTEIVLFTRQLAILLASGMPLEEALHGVVEETEKKQMKSVVSAIRANVREGRMLASGLDRFPKLFNNMYRATVRAGECSGHLDQVLEELAEYTEKQQAISQKLQQATVYPIIMLTVCLSIVSFLLAYVVPQLVGVFAQQNQSLPEITLIVITLSNFIKNNWLVMGIGITLFIVWFKWQLSKENFKEKIDTMMLKMPVIGRAIRVVNTARFARTFGILFSAGLPVLESMAAAANVVTSLPIRYSLHKAEKAVREGVSISKALKATRYFPPMSLHLIASGEVSGQLNSMLVKSATVQDMEVAGLINTVMSLFEPVVTIVMGLIIGVIVIAVLLPVFNMSQLVQ